MLCVREFEGLGEVCSRRGGAVNISDASLPSAVRSSRLGYHHGSDRGADLKPDYSIIIPAYNEATSLPATLACARDAMSQVADFSGEIIVTDNGSDDGTAEVARAGGARVVVEPKRQIARARNAGAAIAAGRYLIFVDADTLISPALLGLTLDRLSSGGVCGGGALPRFDRDPGRAAAGVVVLWHWISKTFRWAAGSYVFCPREAFDAVGGFDEAYYATEELHFSRALKRWGKRRGMRMIILDEPVTTSARKLDWYSTRELLQITLSCALMPWRLRTLKGCRLWYDRPRKR